MKIKYESEIKDCTECPFYDDMGLDKEMKNSLNWLFWSLGGIFAIVIYLLIREIIFIP